MAHVDQFLLHYGYFAIFGLLMLGIVGPLVPDETILVLSGVLIHRGQLHIVPAFIAGFAGSTCGITVSYLLGFYGFGWLDTRVRWFHRFAEQHLSKAEDLFRRYGKWSLFFGYFVAGVRHVTALFAGISCMKFRDFAMHAYPGAVCWVVAFLAIGYYGGEEWSRLGGTVERVILIVAAVALCAIGIYIYRRRTRTTSHP